MGLAGKGTFLSLLIFLTIQVGVPFPGRGAFLLRLQEMPSQRILWEKGVMPEEPFTLSHRNSIYGAWVRERLLVDQKGVFRLTAVHSESPAVLEYYGLDGPSSEWIPLDRTFPFLMLFVTPNGEFSWEGEGKRLDLSAEVEKPTVVEIRLFPFPSPTFEDDP